MQFMAAVTAIVTAAGFRKRRRVAIATQSPEWQLQRRHLATANEAVDEHHLHVVTAPSGRF